MKNACGSSAALLAMVLWGTAGWAQLNPGPVNAPPLATVSAQSAGATSVRIVRLSQVVGTAQMDRGIDRGFEAAFTNLPITQGTRLRTDEGVAEVEFEDNSSLRMTPHSMIEFPILALSPNGSRISTVRVREGTVYVSLAKNKENTFNVLFGKETLALAPAAHIELAITPTERRLDVMDGSVQAADGATASEVGRKHALLFGPANSTAAPTLVSKNEPGSYDGWDKQAVEYHSRYASTSHYASTPYSYGLSDMNYYGSFSSIGGCGSMWRPYMVSANWSPYSNGTWAYYSGAGYSFVSPYPWGWTPFHSGTWNYCSTGGWGWSPNSQWNGLQNMTANNQVPAKTPVGFKPLRPPQEPRPLEATLIPVHESTLVVSKFTAQDTFVFRNDSAGLGVPRGSFGKLNGISSTVVRQGTVERAVFVPSTSTQSQGQTIAGGQRSAAIGSAGNARNTATASNSGAFAGSRGSFSSSGMASASGGGGHFGGMSGGMSGASAGAGSSGGHH